MVGVGSWTVYLQDEGATTPVAMEVAEPLASALARAARVSEGNDKFDLSFSSLFIGVLASEDTVGTLLRSYFDHARVDDAALLKRRNADLAELAGQPAPMDLLSRPLLRTASARSALTEAERVRQDASGPEHPVDLRHVIAAYIALPNYHDDDFRTLRIDRPAWAREFSRAAQELYPAEFDFWSAFPQRAFPGMTFEDTGTVSEVELPSSTLYGFAPDVYSERDLLGIEREVNGLAALIASHKTSVPLSIGLFGKWGSGKTFFIRHLQRRIRELCNKAAESGKPQPEVAYFKHVAQIEFNAWHYSEGTLIASLVEHILQNLRTTDEESEEQVTARRELILGSLIEGRQQEAAAEDKVKAAQDKVDAKQIEIDGLRGKQQEERKKIADNISALAVLDTARTAISLDPEADAAARAALRKLGIIEVGGAARELQATLGRARDELAGIGGILLPLIRGDEQRKRLLWLLAVLATPILGVVLYQVLQTQWPLLATLSGWASSVAAFLTLGKKWLDDQLSWVTARRRELEQAKSVVDDAVERQTRDLQARQARELAQQFEELERLRAEHAAALRERDERARERGELETSLARTSSTYLLNEFIMDRASAKDYRQLLGFMALVRRDFDKLSRLIERSNRRLLDGGGGADAGEPDPGLNRIVLYIDDLDRCPEDRVAEVLRAVHLLLAFPLFVVVVAVDSRWLTRCLMERYPKIFGASDSGPDGATTPMDYLEKIFQIPLWLRHLSASQRVDMVRALLRDGGSEAKTVKADVPPGAPASRAAGVPKARTEASPEQIGEPHIPAPEKAPVQQAHVPVTPEAAHPGLIDLNPPGLTITDREWAFIAHLGPILSHTPRVLKRFANTYRLVKGGLPAEEVRQFVSDRPDAPYRLCLFQLAVLVSMPSFVPAYLGMMREVMAEETKTLWQWHADLSLIVFENDLPKPPYYREEDRARWALLHSHLHETVASDWRECPAGAFAAWAPRVARYTFTPE
jgi:hypothetical protein